MNGRYRVKCKLCGDILESKIPVKSEISCSCGNLKLYNDYIAYNCNKLSLSKEECYEDLDKNKYTYNEIKNYYNSLEQVKIIITNRIQCIYCKDIIESKENHDFKRCSCGRVAIDGGKDYLKRIGNDSDYIELSKIRD